MSRSPKFGNAMLMRHQTERLLGDQGAPLCTECREPFKYQTEDGLTWERCACGIHPLATIRLPELPPPPSHHVRKYTKAKGKKHRHLHPWSLGKRKRKSLTSKRAP